MNTQGQNGANSTPTPKVIKRYQNRKLYDTQQSCYVTLDDIAKMIRAEEEVTVVDNKTKRDITASTLTQIIFEAEKKAANFAPLSVLREIIQNANGSMSSFLAKLEVFKPEERETPVQEYVQSLMEKSQRSYDDVKSKLDERVASAQETTLDGEPQLPTSSQNNLGIKEEVTQLPNSNNNQNFDN